MRSPSVSSWTWLVRKEWRELMSSRAWWIFLLLMGPLVGVSFVSAVQTYAEASGLGGTSAGVGEAFSPLVGIWAPTFSACEIAAAFLLPFVAIRVVAGDRQSGALKIESQHSISAFGRIGAKVVILLIGWLIALAAPAIAIVLWKSYGGSVYAPELAAVVAGHLLNAGLTIALAAAAAAVTDHPATAAIVTLTVTVGTWILTFIAAVHGGIWETAVAYTPTAIVAQFQHGLIRLDVTLIALLLAVAAFSLSSIWIRIGQPIRRRAIETAALSVAIACAISASTFATPNWDVSENRMNSFPRADEQALRGIHEPIGIEVHLAPEDPRRSDFDRRVVSKLRRVNARVQVHYVSSTSIGLFEQSNPTYGEIWYSVGARRAMSRAITPEAALETIYSLAGITAPGDSNGEFKGHPLASPPKHAGTVFYLAWPAIVIMAGVFVSRKSS